MPDLTPEQGEKVREAMGVPGWRWAEGMLVSDGR